MNVFTRTLAAVLFATTAPLAHAQAASANPDNAAVMAALNELNARLDKLETSIGQVKRSRAEQPAEPLTANLNQAVLGARFTERNPLSHCRDVQCYGAGALRKGYEYHRFNAVVMRAHISCAILNPPGVEQIPCSVDEEAGGTHPAMVNGETTVTSDCHSLKCLGLLAIDDMTTRGVIKSISFPTKEECRLMEFEIGHGTPCRGDDDPDPIIKPVDAD